MADHVILVDKNDNELGTEEKILAHQKKLLHRAFSIFLFNDKLEILLQKRAPNKYHDILCAGLSQKQREKENSRPKIFLILLESIHMCLLT